MPISRDGFADEYPFDSHWLDLDGVRMHYVDEGPRDAETILCVHGNPTWSFIWRHLIADQSRERRVIAVDHIGCGLSDKPQDYPYRLEQHIANLRRLVETLDLRNVTLVGHDWGGCIGMGAAGEIPDRFSRFVLLNTGAFRSNRRLSNSCLRSDRATCIQRLQPSRSDNGCRTTTSFTEGTTRVIGSV